MTSQAVERTWIHAGGYGWLRGEWVNLLKFPFELQQGHFPKLKHTKVTFPSRLGWNHLKVTAKFRYFWKSHDIIILSI